MSIFSYIRSIYALDTIDTRFTNASSVPYQTVIDTRAETAIVQAKRDDSVPGSGGKVDRRGKPIAQPSLWRTKEFYFYYFVFLTIVPYMFWIAYDVSRRLFTRIPCLLFSDVFVASDSNYHKYEEFLEPGWIPGRKIVRTCLNLSQNDLTVARIFPIINTVSSAAAYYISSHSSLPIPLFEIYTTNSSQSHFLPPPASQRDHHIYLLRKAKRA